MSREAIRNPLPRVMILTPEEKRSALEEVLQSAAFLRADRLRKFLRYICEMEISGRGSELCESLIGVEALGQPANYSTAENGFVRRKALDLREKLREAYATELASAKIRIELPKGRYVPRFEIAEPATVEPVKNDFELITTHRAELIKEDHVQELVAPARHPFINVFRLACAFVLGAVVTTVVFLSFPSLRRSIPVDRGNDDNVVPSRARAAEPGVIYEADAKTNLLSGSASLFPCNVCEGGKKVRHIGSGPLNFVTFRDVIVGKSGNYVVVIYYMLSGNRVFFVSVNDGPGIEVPLSGDNWMKLSQVAITVPLNAGSNKVKFYNDSSPAPDLSRISIRSAS